MAGGNVKEWICFILFRFILPLAFLTATVFRFCGFSLLYGCSALLNPLIARPTHSSLSQHTGRYLTAVTVLSGITLTAQVVFQSYVSITDESKNQGNNSLLLNCSTLEKTLRQIGLQRINSSDRVNSARIILPDIISFVFSVLVLVACRLLLKPRESFASSTENSDETIRARLFRTGVIIADFLGNFLVIAVTGLCGITTPSILNGVYFIAFLTVATVWSCGVRLSFWFSVYRFLILIYCGLHLVATYINQFEFMADLWINSFQNDTLIERILGLNRFIEVDCSEPLVLHLADDIKWTEYFNVAALLFFYFVVALEVRRRTATSALVVEFSPLISLDEPAAIVPADDNSSSLIDVTAGSSEAQGLIQGRKSPVPHYHSMDRAEFNVGADLGEASELERGTPPSPADDVPKHHKESLQWETAKYVVKTVVAFGMQQSYIATLVTMMAWSITYPSWLTFVFLISACVIWMIPKKRTICMRFSPVIVFYAECLLTLTYIYGFDLTNTELPSRVADGYNLNDIGLVKFGYPIGPLAAQVAFTCVFWLNLYQFTWESKSTTIGTSRMDASSLETLEGMTEGEGHQKKKFAAVNTAMCWLWDFLCKYWIFLCGTLFLVMALQEAVIFRMIYMVLFLCFVISFQLNYAFWRCCVKIFWSSVIVYSMIVLVLIYVFQFEFVIEKWQNATGMSESLMHDFGFRKYDTAALFVELLTPTSFLIFIILHLHYFQTTFLALSDVNRYRNDDSFDNRFSDEPDQENPTTDSTAAGDDKLHGFQQKILLILSHFVTYVNYAMIIGWRLLEVHFHKLILMSVFLVCVNDVNAVNVVFIVLLVVFLLLGFRRMMSFVSMFLCSVIALVRMIYQLNLINEEHLFSNCTELKNVNTSISGMPPPFNSTFNNAHYLGLRKADSMSHYVKDYMILVILFTFESIIIVHQRQYYNHPQHSTRPPAGIIFPGINRKQADIDLVNCAMFLVNYGFYKFGKEICFVMTVVTMVVRLDIFSIVYGVLLGFFLLLGRRKCRCLWPGYVILLAILVVIQYISCVGVPLILCWQYPWLIDPSDMSHMKSLEVFLYLPDYIKPPDATKLIADFFQLLFVCLQWKVFGEEMRITAAEEGGSNRSIAKEVSDVESGIKQNPVDDFVSYRDSYLDYVKVGVFYYSFWVTLLVLFITGTVRISIFCLGYLVACFFFLWFGQDLLLKPIKTIQRMWTVVLIYSYLVILLKCCFQFAGCVYLRELNCAMVQLFNIVCLQSDRYVQPGADDCVMDKDMSGMSWDAASFAFLLFLIRIYRTWYFQRIVTDLKVDSHLASRGSELINFMLYKRVEEHRASEAISLEKIRKKMERIKMRQYRLNPKSTVSSNDHYVVIRSGDYYMFDDLTEDELELQTEASEDRVLDDDAKKPGPIQILNAGFQGGTKVALDLWDHPSPSSPTPSLLPFERQDDVPLLSSQQMVPESDESASGGDAGQLVVTFQRDTSSHDITVLKDVRDDREKVDEANESESFSDKVLNVLKLTILVLRASIEKVILFLKDLSKDYSDVSLKLKEEKEQYKQRMKHSCQGESNESNSQLIVSTEEEGTITRPSQIDLQLGESDNRCDGNEIEKQKQAERTFHREMPIFFRLLVAGLEVVLSHSDLLCYFAMILNVLMSGSVVSLVYPILTFLWALLSTPRPSKEFWVFIITYTEVLIIIKYVFQFPFIPWNMNNQSKEKNVFDLPYIFGIEKKNAYAVFDIILLFCVFIHRSVLKQHGLWKGAEQSQADLENAELASRQVTPATSPGDSKRKGIDFGGSGEPASHFGEDDNHDSSLQETENTLAVVLPESKDGELEAEKEQHKQEDKQNDASGCNRCIKSLGTFCRMLRNPQYSAAADVYARMFFCDLITFIIVIFGYSSFGPGDSNDSPTTAFMNVATVIKQNKIPASFLGMMLAQFILIIIDRAIYLRKQIFVKLIFQVFLVALVHVWMFFALPQITNRRFVDNVAAQLWYFTKCIYFGFSSYQIRCGYPTRILGNFLTLKYNYLNLFSFQAFLVIPFLLELRALMDWMFTDTTLALGSWLQMEDIYANIFVIKCNRKAEKTYPVQRGQKRQALVKYGLGGIILFLLIFIIWFPLLLFSLSESIYEPNRPVSVSVGLRIQGFEPMFKMTAQGDDLEVFSQKAYNELRKNAPANMKVNTFMDMYRKEDIYKCKLLGMSAATWDITPPYLERLMKQLTNNTTTSIYFSLAFTREPAPSLKSETVTGEFERVLYNNKDQDLLTALADMLSNPSENKNVTVTNLFPHFVTVPASGKPASVDYLFTNESNNTSFKSGTGSLLLSYENSTGTKWWTIKQIAENVSDTLDVTSFNERIAPAGVLSLLSSYGVIGLYVSLVLVIGRFVRMWIQGLSFKIMFVELPNPDVLLKLCLDIYMVRESGELMLEEELFAQLIFLYRSPETLIKVTKHAKSD